MISLVMQTFLVALIYRLLGPLSEANAFMLFEYVTGISQDVPANAMLWVVCNTWDKIPPTERWRWPGGRAPITWVHQICSDIGLSTCQALAAAQEQTKWRTIPMATCSAKHWRRSVHCGGRGKGTIGMNENQARARQTKEYHALNGSTLPDTTMLNVPF